MITAYHRFAIAGLLAVATLVIGQTGCDSTSGPPADAQSTPPKDVPPEAYAGKKSVPKSIKNRPTPTAPPETPK